MAWLSALPATEQTVRIGRRTQVRAVHATFDDPLWGVSDPLHAVRRFVAARDVDGRRRGGVWLAGATHAPSARRAQPRAPDEKTSAGLRAARHDRRQELRAGDWLIHPGAVGVANGGDSAAWWALLSFAGVRAVTFRRVRYDTRPVLERIARANLPVECAFRIDPTSRAA